MTDLLWFISSQFDGSGHQAAMQAINQAGIKTKELKDAMHRLKQSGDNVLGQAFTTESIQNADRAAISAKRTADALNIAATIASNKGFKDLSRELRGMAKEAENASKEFRSMISSEEALIKGSKNLTKDVKGVGKSLDDLNKRYAQLEEAAKRYASAGMSGRLSQTQKAMSEIKKEMGSYAQTVVKMGGVESQTGEKREVNHRKMIKNLSKEIELLERKILTLRVEAVELDRLGDKSGAAMRMAKAGDLEKTVRMFRQTRQSVAEAHKGFAGLNSFIKSDFLKALNLVGFTMFITKSSINTVVGALRAVYNAGKQAATIMDKFRGASTVFNMHGFDANAVRAKFVTAAQGAVTMEQAMAGAMQFMKAGQPQLAASADELLSIARASAKLSGDLSQTATIYDKLIRGVVRGSPKLIDDTGIVLKLGDANQKYAASIGKTVEQLTAADKIMATYQATIEGGKVIKQMAAATESAAEKFVKLEGALSNRRIALVTLAMLNLTNAFQGSNQSIDEFIDGMEAKTLIMNEYANISQDYSQAVREAADREVTAMTLINESLSKTQLQRELANDGIIGRANLLRMERGETVLLGADMQSLVLAFHELEYAKRKDYELEQARLGNFEEVSKATELQIRYEQQQKEAYDAVTESISKYIEKLRERIGIDPRVDLRGEGAANNFQTILDNIQEAWKQSDRDEEILELETDLQEKLVEIDDKYTQDRLDVQEKYKDEVAKLAEETREAIEEKREDFNKSITRMQEDLDDKLDSIHAKSLEKSEDTETKHKKKMEDLEEDHQKKLSDIQRKFELARLKAIIDRDARALFEAEARRAEDVAKANENANDKKDAEIAAVKEKRAQIAAEEAAQTAKAAEEYEKRKQRMQEDYDDQINQMRENFQKQKAEKNAQRKQDLDELREAWKKQKEEEQKRHDERLEDMKKAWERERIESQRANFIREQERLMSLLREGEMTEEWMQQYIQSWRDFSDVLQGMEIAAPTIKFNPRDFFGGEGQSTSTAGRGSGGGTSGGGTSGGGGSSSPSPGAVIPGTSCSGMGGRGYTGYDGQTYLCWNGVWTLASAVNGGEPSSSNSSVNTPLRGSGTVSGGNVTLNVQGDDLVKGIIKDTTYDVILEVYE